MAALPVTLSVLVRAATATHAPPVAVAAVPSGSTARGAAPTLLASAGIASAFALEESHEPLSQRRITSSPSATLRHASVVAAAAVMKGEPTSRRRDGDNGSVELAPAARPPMPRLLARRRGELAEAARRGGGARLRAERSVAAKRQVTPDEAWHGERGRQEPGAPSYSGSPARFTSLPVRQRRARTPPRAHPPLADR